MQDLYVSAWGRRRRLWLVKADVVDQATPAFGLPRFAHIAAMQDQPVMAIVLVALWHHPIEGELDLERRLAGRKPGAVRDPEDVGIDGDGGLAEGDIEHDIRRLAANSGKGDERFAIVRHLAIELGDELLRQRDQVFGLAAIKPNGLDLVGEPSLAER